MKSRIKVASILLLVAMVLSFVPAAATPSSASAAQSCSDWAQFVADVTVPDGTRFDPNTPFKKTWRLKNIGTCTWTNSYSMVFVSGTQMGPTSSVPMPPGVAPGQTVDVSVDMVAPNAAGNYRGYWQFKNPGGVLFGIGYYANKPWWVEIGVTGGTGGVAYNFSEKAETATWASGAGGLTFPGTDGDAKGFALRLVNAKFESGATASQPSLLVGPQQVTNGFIEGRYPAFTVQNGDRFQATVGCAEGATSCYVQYRLDYKVGNTIRTFWRFRERFEGWTYSANLNLSPLAGQNVEFILHVDAYGSPVGDRSLWGNPVIVRQGAPPPVTFTGTPPTATPSKTPGPVTVTVPPSTCDKAAFIADVTVPDGTVMNPGQSFTKTWRLKNIGKCAWNTNYQLVFFSGEKMGAADSYKFTKDVPVGQTWDFSVPIMVAPMTPGTYRGYWMFKNANNQLFGIGTQGNKPWWVEIKVAGPTVTPGGPTNTPTVTPTPGSIVNSAFDFATLACSASWSSGAGAIACPGSTDGDPKGYVLQITNPKLENGTPDSRPGLLTGPQSIQNGYIRGVYLPFKVNSGDRFRSTVSCENGATACNVYFYLDYQIGNGPVYNIWSFHEVYDNPPNSGRVDRDLSWLAGKDVKFILRVSAGSSAAGDRALWIGPHIYRVGGVQPGQPPTSTATATATMTGTTTVTTTVTATGTATVTTTATATGSPTSTVTSTATQTPTETPTATTAPGG